MLNKDVRKQVSSQGIAVPLFIFLALATGSALFVFHTLPLLPERLATHFDLGGLPNRWQSRESYLGCVRLMGLGSILFTGAMTLFLVTIGRKRFPHLSVGYLLKQGLWLACLVLLFNTGLIALISSANRETPPHIHGSWLALFLGCLIIPLVFWAGGLRFAAYRKEPKP